MRDKPYTVIWEGHLWIGGLLLFGVGVRVGLATGLGVK